MILVGTLDFENIQRPWLWLAVAAVAAWVLWTTYRGFYRRYPRALVWGLMLLRVAGLAALVLALARPIWTRTAELVDPGRVAIVIDDSVSMSLAAAGGKPRYALARAKAELLESEIKLGEGPRMEVDLFDIGGRPLRAIPAEPRAQRTDLAGGIRQAIAQLRSRPLAGVVLLSDGADNTGLESHEQLSESPVPVYTVGFSPDAEASRLDLSVANVQAPERVMVNNEAKVDVLVQKVSGAELEATVVVKRGRQALTTEKVLLPAGDAEQVVSVRLTPAEAGAFVYTAAVLAEAGERLAANNARHFPLQVDADAIRVLYLEGFLRYEYKFLKNRLEDDPDVGLVTIVRQANPERVDTASRGDLLSPERLAEFEVVILGDMEGKWVTQQEHRALVEWVDAGHGLVVMGGYRSFGPDGFRSTPLADALPVVFAAEPPLQSEDPFVLEFTEKGREHPIFEISGDRVKDASLWAGAPHLLGASVVERAKPGADVLAVNPGTIVEGSPAVVVAAQRYGAGHTLVVCTDTTWRWSRLARVAGQADTLFARFWGQTVRWLAGREPLDARPPLVVSTDRPAYEAGKPVQIRAVRQPAPGSETAGEVRLEVLDEAGRSQAVPLRTSSAEPNVSTGTVYPSSGGRYQVLATLTAAGSTTANQTAEFLVHGSDLELSQAAPDRERLESMARLTGGLYFDIERAGDLVERIERRERRVSRIERTDFWSSPRVRTGLFLFFLAAVTGEWVLRRRNHLM